MALDNLRGGTKRVVEENTPLNNLRGGTKRVVIVDGGGGSVDYAKTVQRAETMPTADASNAGQQFLYSGESDATYTHGYIYENVATTTSSSASAEQTVGSTLSDIAVDLATLESFTGWTTDNSLQIFYTADGWSVDTTSLGVTYTGTPNVGDAITITYTAESTSYAWTQIDVQPAGSSLPDQTGHSGEFLTTDGTDASWGAISEVPSTTGATQGDVLTVDGNGDAVWQAGGGGGSYTAGTGIDITGTTISTEIPMAISSTDSTAPTVTVKSDGTGVIAIGAGAKAGSALYGTQSIAIGEGARASSSVGGYNNVAIGGDSYAGGISVAIGASTNTGTMGGVAIGYGVRAGNAGIIIGSDISASTTGTAGGFDIVIYDPVTFTSTMYNVIKKGGEINPDRLGTGYDATKTQTLKNVQGVLTWVDD